MAIAHVGIREFRASLAEYIAADAPVAVTRHGQTVGLFVPLRRPAPEDIQRLREAGAALNALLPMTETDLDAVVARFDDQRRSAKWAQRNRGKTA